MMELYLLRHGIAVDRAARRVKQDSDRPLTSEGVGRTRKVAEALAALGARFDRVFTSPYVRARQTADIVVEVLGIPGALCLCEALVPGSEPGILISEINRLSQRDSRILLVGHEPGLSSLASLLISGRSDANIILKKAGVCVLETNKLVAGRCASLRLLLTPKQMLRTLG